MCIVALFTVSFSHAPILAALVLCFLIILLVSILRHCEEY